MNSILDLLNSIEENRIQEVSEEFNIFKILGIQYNEVLICRFLGELLNPTGMHGCGAVFLEEFFKTVLKKDIKNLQNADVVLEDRTDAERRVDIAVYTENEVFPIEVKVWAKDQKSQLSDYWNYYKKGRNRINCIYYLTPYGKHPSKDSLGELKINEQCICISFKDEIQKWLDNCEIKLNDEKIKSEIRQFKGVIEVMCKNSEDFEKIKEAVFKTDKTKNSALQILKFKDKIIEEFRISFLKNRINFGDKFKLEYNLTDDECDKYNKGRESLLAKIELNSDETVIAYVCYETNLYMYVPDSKHRIGKWIGADNNEYYWRYIEFTKNKHINFNKPWENDDPKFWDDTIKINIADYIK